MFTFESMSRILFFLLPWLAIPAHAQVPGCEEVSRGRAAPCFMASQPDESCNRDCISEAYYNGFTGKLFNLPHGRKGCLPWRFLLSGNNCRDNPNFNPAQVCNSVNERRPFAGFPRMEVLGEGRLGSGDSCVQLNCYPGDHYRTKKQNGRAEMLIKPEISEGKESWFAWSFRLPENFVMQRSSNCPNASFRYTHFIIAQIHSTEKGKCPQAGRPFEINLRGNRDGQVAVVRFGAYCGEKRSEAHRGRFPVRPGVWYDVVMRIGWSADPDGGSFDFDAWEEGSDTPVFTSRIRNARSLFRNAGNGYGIFHLGAYTGKSFCRRVSVQVDEFSIARSRCCLESPRVGCDCE